MTMATDAENPGATGDPFERALAREEAYRQRRSRRDLADFLPFRMFGLLGLGFVVAWGGLLTFHWQVFEEPRWLAVLHTMVYGVGLIYFTTIAIAFSVMKRKPAAFGLVDDDE